MTLAEVLRSIDPADQKAAAAARDRWDSIAKPLGSLGALEDAVIRIAAMTGTPDVDISRRAVVVMCADNGVVAQGVTQTGQEVTAIVAENMSAGDTSVCAMANLKPVPDSLENLKVQRQLIEDTASIHVYPYGAITVGEQGEVLADLEEMAPYVAGFSDDGRGVQSREMMKQAMEKAKSLLENTSKRAYEVAEEVGFADPHYFSVSFKKATGKTPTEYAKEKRNR